MFERPQAGECAILVSITINRLIDPASLDEFAELARSAGVMIGATLTGTRDTPDPHTFVGRGKLSEMETLVQEYGAEVVLFNHALTPGQERNLERVLQCRVVDRTGVILDIFAKRALSFEGKYSFRTAKRWYWFTWSW